MAPDLEAIVTAGLLIIGNEILSGRTLDTNTQHIAKKLASRGIRLMETRVVPDIPDRIIGAVNELRDQNDYVFTTGGIGPTHDDITAENIAAAFGVVLELNPEALKMMEDYYQPRQIEITPARAKMAMVPKGSMLIPNPVSGAPGFIIGNVYCMAGVPHIMQAMLENIIDTLEGGALLLSESVEADVPESTLAQTLSDLQKKYPDVDMGSYPYKDGDKWGATLVLRSTSQSKLASAKAELESGLKALRA